MIDFPSSTKVNRRLPKEAFYRHLSLSTSLKAKFVSDVESLTVENSLTQKNLHLGKESKIQEILLLSIKIKGWEFDGKIAEAIARQNPHQLIFLLQAGEDRQLLVYHGRLYRSPWKKENDLYLTLSGETLDAIWENIVRQIALDPEEILDQQEESLDDQLARQQKIDRLNALIAKTEKAVWKETQPKKRFALYSKLQEYKKELDAIREE